MIAYAVHSVLYYFYDIIMNRRFFNLCLSRRTIYTLHDVMRGSYGNTNPKAAAMLEVREIVVVKTEQVKIRG